MLFHSSHICLVFHPYANEYDAAIAMDDRRIYGMIRKRECFDTFAISAAFLLSYFQSTLDTLKAHLILISTRWTSSYIASISHIFLHLNPMAHRSFFD
jgi:hypothetical protein